LLDSSGHCSLIRTLIESGLLVDPKLARVVVISKLGKRDWTSMKFYRSISLLPTIAKLVEQLIACTFQNKMKYMDGGIESNMGQELDAIPQIRYSAILARYERKGPTKITQ
jgi:hypothetical protein